MPAPTRTATQYVPSLGPILLGRMPFLISVLAFQSKVGRFPSFTMQSEEDTSGSRDLKVMHRVARGGVHDASLHRVPEEPEIHIHTSVQVISKQLHGNHRLCQSLGCNSCSTSWGQERPLGPDPLEEAETQWHCGTKRSQVKPTELKAARQSCSLRTQDSRLRTQDSGLRAQGSGLRTQDSGLRTQDSGCKKQGFNSEPRRSRPSQLSSGVQSPSCWPRPSVFSKRTLIIYLLHGRLFDLVSPLDVFLEPTQTCDPIGSSPEV
ncbi:unnamed protein product [Pleuronectes platessa]|uniref:Uncharacterized protein n=1 Tax=Pleuronectes platessa TaxID=8262 RepID=A0A9N7W2K3_PLEPL|nr:unnamed protein product [Pleuronectes platessa]